MSEEFRTRSIMRKSMHIHRDTIEEEHEKF